MYDCDVLLLCTIASIEARQMVYDGSADVAIVDLPVTVKDGIALSRRLPSFFLYHQAAEALKTSDVAQYPIFAQARKLGIRNCSGGWRL